MNRELRIEIARQTLDTYKGAFKKVSFAILDNPSKTTIPHFEQALHCKQ